MAKKQDPEPKEEPKTDPVMTTTDPPPQTTAGSTPPTDEPPKGYVTEESYKGLQRVVTQKDTDLDKAKKSIEDISAELEELKTDSTGLTSDKSNLETKLEEAKTSVDNLQSERDNLSNQVERQTVIMTEYPHLATVAEYIPPADDVEGFKENAKAFSEALGGFVDAGVKTKITGATPPTPAGKEDTTAQQAEIDALWDTVGKTAGIPGKEEVFLKAQARLEELMPE